MAESFEIPKDRIKPVGKGDFSAPREIYEAKKRELDRLNDRIIERCKFLEKEKNPETVKKIRDEILRLRMEKIKVSEIALDADKDHRDYTERLEDFDPEEEGGNA